MSVGLIDEAAARRRAGFSGCRPRSGIAHGKPDDEPMGGDELRAAIAASGCTAIFGRRVWTVARGFQVDAAGERRPTFVHARRA